MKFEIKYPNKNVAENDIVEDIKRVAGKLKKNTVTQDEYDEYGVFCHNTVYRKIGSWPKALEMAGLQKSNTGTIISNEELFRNLQEVWIKLGRQPKYGEIIKPLSEYHVATYERRFGGWIKALESFAKYIDEESEARINELGVQDDYKNRRTNRSINLRLRFKVMKRDRFKCCMCGRTPANENDITLEVDHIKPWSKGGETEIDNLQTLCNLCNQGKSNLE